MNIYRVLLDLARMHATPSPLERVLETLGAAINECNRAIIRAEASDVRGYIEAVVDDECDTVEALIGAAFIACQAELTAVVSRLIRIHQLARNASVDLSSSDGSRVGILALGSSPVAPSQHSRVQVIDAFANYFKHHEEWQGPWAQLKPPASKTVAIISAVGATQYASGNMRTGAKMLGISEHWNLAILGEQVTTWATTAIGTYERELQARSLILGHGVA